MRSLARAARRWLFAAAILGKGYVILHPEAQAADMVLGAVVAAALALSLWEASPFYLVAGGMLLLGGVYLLVSAGQDILAWSRAAHEMLVLFTLITVIPLLSIPLELGRYPRTFFDWLQAMGRGPTSRFLAATGLSFILSLFVTMGSIPIAYGLLRESARRSSRQPDRYLSIVLSRGFGWADVWSPLSIAVVTVQYLTGASWSHILPLGLAMFLAGVVLNVAVERRFLRETDAGPAAYVAQDEAGDAPNPSAGTRRRQVLEMAAVLAGIGAVVGAAPRFSRLPAVYWVVFSALGAAVLWSAYLRRLPKFFRAAAAYGRRTVPNLQNLFVLFISSGFLARAAAGHPLAEEVARGIGHLFETYPPGVAILSITGTIFAVAQLGVHPLAVVTVLGRLLSPEVLGVTPAAMASALLLGLSVSSMTSAFSATSGLVASVLQVSPFDVGPRWNLKYGLSWFGCALLGLWIFAGTGL